MPQRVTAEFEVVTPLFLGGADPVRTVELRAPSIKGVLRFWWRALAWSRHDGNLEAIRREESRLFGAAGDDPTSGQSSFALRARWLQERRSLHTVDVRSLTDNRPGTGYLSYGVINRGSGQNPRPCYELGGRFELELRQLRSKKKVEREPQSEFDVSIVDALKLFGLLGDLGGRGRRGWGSVALTRLDGCGEWQAPRMLGEYKTILESLLQNSINVGEPPYSAFSMNARVLVLDGGDDPLAALNRIGESFQTFRRENRTFIFGLPHRRFKGDASRRASPLLFHVHKLGGNWAIALTFLRGLFLPDGKEQYDYGPVHGFLKVLRDGWTPRPIDVLDGANSRQ